MPISVVIVAKNEEKKIGMVLDAVQSVADEIIVVDSGSTDKTVSIAQNRGARTLFQDWLGYAAQKNFAMSLATYDWILSLDADEVLTKELQDEIIELKKSQEISKFDGYKIPRILLIGDTKVRFGGFYPDAQLRLIKKGCGQFNDRMVHEAIKVSGPVRTLQNHMLHYSYNSVEEFSQAMEKFARLSAQEYKKQSESGIGEHKNKYQNAFTSSFRPVWTFFYRYFLRGGFMDGALGLRLATEYSNYVRKKIEFTRQKD
ncbi:MAG: glycosyltransferase family 2 protein [Candidatus Melainabacteria bacterium]|nr:glycosyltransferase family 2 protein [Candidatus Melainabacteria bacterium]